MNQFKSLALYAFILVCLYLSIRCIYTLENINNRLDRANTEYQFVVEDRDIIVYDRNRLVGRVKLQGQLYSLLREDNQ